MRRRKKALDALKKALAGKEEAVRSTPAVSELMEQGAAAAAMPTDGADRVNAGFLMQLTMLSLREAKYLWRNKPGLIASIVMPLVLNLFFAGIFSGSGDVNAEDYSVQGHFGGVSQIAIGAMFGAAQPLLLRFPLDPNHSHFLLVDDGTRGNFGVERSLRGELEDLICKGNPSEPEASGAPRPWR